MGRIALTGGKPKVFDLIKYAQSFRFNSLSPKFWIKLGYEQYFNELRPAWEDIEWLPLDLTGFLPPPHEVQK